MLNSEQIAEQGKYFGALPQIVTKLPKASEVKDKAQVMIKQTDGTYIKYQMLGGSWYSQGTLTKV